MQYLRSVIYFACMVVTAIFYSIVSLPTVVLPFEARYRFIRRWAWFNIWLLERLVGLRYQVEGEENIPQGAFILMSKHQSTWETYAFQKIFPPLVWVLKKELLRVPFFGWGLALLEPIAIDRKAKKQAMTQVIEQGIERLKTGKVVVIFPEGTRIPAGQKGRYKLGGARLAVESGYPIVPVAHNAGEYWPRRGLLKKPGVIKVVIGKPIDPAGKSAEELIREVEDFIEGQMQRITTLKKPSG